MLYNMADNCKYGELIVMKILNNSLKYKCVFYLKNQILSKRKNTSINGLLNLAFSFLLQTISWDSNPIKIKSAYNEVQNTINKNINDRARPFSVNS